MGNLPNVTLMKRNRGRKAMGLTSVLARPQRAHHGCHGFTLVEVIIASLVVAVVAGGTMMAFIASANMTGPYSYGTSRTQDLPTLAEANALVQQTVERLRNEVVEPLSPSLLASQVGLGWQSDNPAALPVGADTASKLAGVKRCYRVVWADCDGNGVAANDCYLVQTQVCWNNLTGCACP